MKFLNFTLVIAFVVITSSLFSQTSENVTEIIKECACREVVMITRGVEKSYTGVWLENVGNENGYVVFSKGDYKHRWNSDKITFIEKGNGFIRIYLN